ncbi:hypothetical protein Hanom_Chr10g00954691 [Helianthus anomalus]
MTTTKTPTRLSFYKFKYQKLQMMFAAIFNYSYSLYSRRSLWPVQCKLFT